MHFPVRHGHAGHESGAGKSDKVLRANVGREDRGTDLQPVRIATREEVILTRLILLAHGEENYPDHAEDEEGDHQPIKPVKDRLMFCDGSEESAAKWNRCEGLGHE